MEFNTDIVRDKKRVTFLLLTLIVWHLLTIGVSPMPWYDEVYFADIAINFKETSRLLLTISPEGSKEIPNYGPLYFLFQQPFLMLFGNSPLSLRLLNLLAGLTIVFLLLKKTNYHFLIACVILLSPIYIQNLHSGRMDLFATLPVFMGFLWLEKKHISLKFSDVAIAAILFSVGALITPRVIFLIPGACVFLISDAKFLTKENLKIKRFILYSLFSAVVVLGAMFIWAILTSGVGDYQEEKSIAKHMGISLLRKRPEDILFIFFFAAFAFQLYKNKTVDILLVAISASFFSFALFVKEAGPYAAMIIPFILYGIGVMQFNKFMKGVMALVIIGFAGIFLVKSAVIFSDYNNRKFTVLNEFLEKNDVKEKKVLTSFLFFYSLKNKNNDVKCHELVKLGDTTTANKLIHQSYDFVLIKNLDIYDFGVEQLINNNSYELVDSFKSDGSNLLKHLPIVGTRYGRIIFNYNCLLYKRVD